MKNHQYYCCNCKKTLTRKKQRNGYSYYCTECQQSYPISEFGFPCLFNLSDEVIAQAYKACHQTANSWADKASSLSQSLKSSQRKKSLLPLLHAYNQNAKFFADWAKPIEPLANKQLLASKQADNNFNQYGYNFNYLSQDWALQPANNKASGSTKSLDRIMRLASTRGRAAALGLGTGRFGLELGCYFDEIIGIDASYAHVIQYHSLLKSDINFWNTETRNKLKTNKIAQKIKCSIPDKFKVSEQKLQFLWGDAFNFPCPDNHFDWVFSVYFSDIRPLHEMLDETLRILKPGGYFAHIGPLEYHFKELEYHYSFEEFKQQFVNNGFAVIHESLTESNLQSADNSLKISGQYHDKVLLLQRQ